LTALLGLAPAVVADAERAASTSTTATSLQVSAPSNATAGIDSTVTVTAKDSLGATVTGFSDSVHFSSSDAQAILPADVALTAGTGTFTLLWRTSGFQAVQAMDVQSPSVFGISSTVVVSPAAADHLVLSGPNAATVGTPESLTVSAEDHFSNVDYSYAGTVSFSASCVPTASTSCAGASPMTLPGPYGFVAGKGGDNGVHTFTSGATLNSPVLEQVTVTDGSISGQANLLGVGAGGATHFGLAISGSGIVAAGTAFSFTVTALAEGASTATGYTGTVHFSVGTSTGGGKGSVRNDQLPADSTLANGTGTFSATLFVAGNRTLTATDAAFPEIHGQALLQILGAAVDHLRLTTPGQVEPGAAFSGTLTPVDQFENPTSGYTGTVHFSGGGTGATLPADYSFGIGKGGGGSATFTNGFALPNSGTFVISATDISVPSITGSMTVAVLPRRSVPAVQASSTPPPPRSSPEPSSSPNAPGSRSGTPDPPPGAQSLPPSLTLAVPYTSQAPYDDWDAFHQYTCEAAAVLMLGNYFGGDHSSAIPPDQAEASLQRLMTYEEGLSGQPGDFRVDLMPPQFEATVTAFYPGISTSLKPFTAGGLRNELAAGHVVVIPLMTGRLRDPAKFTSVFHYLVVKGYSGDTAITNDAGLTASVGKDAAYPIGALIAANADVRVARPLQWSGPVMIVASAGATG
jgi:hypothetical protein